MHHEAASNLPGTVEKIIKPIIHGEAEKVLIAIRSGEHPNQTIPIANILVDARGESGLLKKGAPPCTSSSDRSRKTQLSNSDSFHLDSEDYQEIVFKSTGAESVGKDDGRCTGI